MMREYRRCDNPGQSGKPLCPEIVFCTEVDSTNSEAKRRAQEGAPQGLTIIAGTQSGGRGRLGREWKSSGKGLYMSVLLRPKLLPSETARLTIVAGIATFRVLSKYYSGARIKWPNDIVADGRKLCGILCEMQTFGDDSFAVAGFGVNVNEENFEGELSDKAVSLKMLTGKPFDVVSLGSEIAQEFLQCYEQFLRLGLIPFQKEYNKSLICLNKRIVIVENGAKREVCALGIDSMGRLSIRDMDGREGYVNYGEISIRGIMGYI